MLTNFYQTTGKRAIIHTKCIMVNMCHNISHFYVGVMMANIKPIKSTPIHMHINSIQCERAVDKSILDALSCTGVLTLLGSIVFLCLLYNYTLTFRIYGISLMMVSASIWIIYGKTKSRFWFKFMGYMLFLMSIAMFISYIRV